MPAHPVRRAPRRAPPRRKPVTPGLSQRARLFLPLRSWRIQLLAGAAAIILAILSAQSFASAAASPSAYLIQTGDTLLAIAARTGVPVDRLIAVNSIKNPDVIIAGQSLQLDQSSTSTSATNASNASNASAGPAYTVKAGDTLSDIAQANHVNIDDMVKLNQLNNADQLTVGQQLRLPQQTNLVAAAIARPQPKQTAARANALQQRIIAQVQSVAGADAHVGFTATNLVTGERVAWHADDEFPSASVMKLPILVELERQISAGSLTWSDSLRAEARAMIGVSDNTAANQIAQAIHQQSVNDTMARLGLGGTRFLNLFDGGRTSANPGENETTPSNMAHLLELVATDQVVNSQVSGDIRSLLAQNADGSKLVRMLPPDARVAHKSGWYDGVANDVGIVTVDRVPTRWVIAVFTEKIHDAETGNQLIASISRTVYDAWAPSS
ncbi:MAG: serine hydrolase [Chloroflexi bacterium]|nr:serine hydrolase [Chloroflexota bacterium]